MTVLDTFLILFESDASDAKKDVDSLDNSLEDIEKTSKGTVTASDKVSSSFLGMGKSALGAIAGVVALGSVVSKLFSQAASIDELQKFSQTVGENVGDVDAWGRAVERAGGTAEGFQQSLRMLNEQMVDASIKGQNEITPFFNQLGVSIVDTNGKVRSTLDLLPELAEAFEGLSKQESTGIAKRLGLDQGTILLLQSGRRETELSIKRQKELGTVTAGLADKAEAFRFAQRDASTASQILGQKILGVLLPAGEAILKTLTKVGAWISDNSAAVIAFFLGLGAVIGVVLAPAIWAAVVAMVALLAPFAAVAALAVAGSAALALLVDDFIAFENGAVSFMGKWPIIGKTIRSVLDFLIGSFKEFGHILFAVWNAPLGAIKIMTNAIKGLVDFAKAAFGTLMGIITAPLRLLDSIGDKVKDKFGSEDSPEGSGEEEGKGIFQSFKDIFGSDDEDLQNIINAKKTIQLADSAAIGAQTGNSIQNSSRVSNRNTSVQTGDIVINTQATDADAIASEVSGSLDRQLRNTVYDFDDGLVS